jgi:hypothetical protein
VERQDRTEILDNLKILAGDVKQLSSSQVALTEQIKIYTKDLTKLEESVATLALRLHEQGDTIGRHAFILKLVGWAVGIVTSVWVTHAAQSWMR